MRLYTAGMKRYRLVACVAAVICWLLSAPLTVQAWNDAGHRLTAMIAYEQLSPAVRTAVAQRLREHPRFRADFMQLKPLDVSGADTEQWLFTQAAVWPDLARNFAHVVDDRRDLQGRFHQGSWHYINWPLFLPGTSTALPAQLNIKPLWYPGMGVARLNLLQALHRAQWMQQQTDDAAERALALAWIFHLVGDAHQPLHSTALFTPGAFPEGDQGGNRLRVFARTLHSRWDGAVTAGRDWKALQDLAAMLMFEHGAVAAQVAQHRAPVAWIRESHQLARALVYTAPLLNAVAAFASPQDSVAVYLSDAYVADMQAVARERVTIAGYRLARLLEALFAQSVAPAGEVIEMPPPFTAESPAGVKPDSPQPR